MAQLSAHMRTGTGWALTIDQVPEDVKDVFVEKLSEWCEAIPHDWKDPVDDRPFAVSIVALAQVVRTAMKAARLYRCTPTVQIIDGVAVLNIACSRYYVQQLMGRERADAPLVARWMIWRMEGVGPELRNNMIFQSMDKATIARQLPLLIVADEIEREFEKQGLIEDDSSR